jgi:hypothetical protein
VRQALPRRPLGLGHCSPLRGNTARLLSRVFFDASLLTAPRNYSQEADDWNPVYQMMEVLKVVSAEPEKLIAAQCFQALEALVSIANGQFSTNREASGRKIFIPYFGMINVAPVSSFMNGTTQGAAPHLQEVDLPLATSSQASNPIIDIDVFNALSLGNGLQNLNSVPQSGFPNDILHLLWILIKTRVGC